MTVSAMKINIISIIQAYPHGILKFRLSLILFGDGLIKMHRLIRDEKNQTIRELKRDGYIRETKSRYFVVVDRCVNLFTDEQVTP